MYTIQFLSGGTAKRDKVYSYLQTRLAKDGRFSCTMELGEEKVTREDRRADGNLYSAPCIRVRKVRLTQKKPYCGNHPGECPISSKPKPVSSMLEWDDWVAFNNLVNKALNRFRANANVWSLPHDVKGRMWIRKGTRARLCYSWKEQIDSYGRMIRIWNQGTEDQFAA